MSVLVGRTFTGAWIETLSTYEPKMYPTVAPLRVRGLKRQCLSADVRQLLVAPLRVRGLKLAMFRLIQREPKVAPLRVRGLKRLTFSYCR